MLDCQRDHFFLPEDIAYLNGAYMSPLLRTVEDAGIEGMRKKRMPWKIDNDDFFGACERLKTLYARLIHTREPHRLAIIPSVSYGMANVANNLHLKKGDELVVAGEQFPSNVYPWMAAAERHGANLKIVPAPTSVSGRGKAWNERILESITPATRLVAIAHVHWADGTLFNLKAIRKRTNEVGALLVIDGTQSVGALPFSIEDIRPDALIVAGYKWLMGPYSIGMAWYGPVFDGGRPIEENWIARKNSEDFANLVNYQPEYQPGALRYEMGERSNFILVPMFHAAIRQLLDWGVENVQMYSQQLVTGPIGTLRMLGCDIEEDAWRGSHLFGIRLPNERIDISEVKKRLIEERIIVSYRGDAIRVSPNIYNTQEELWKLVNVFEEVFRDDQ